MTPSKTATHPTDKAIVVAYSLPVAMGYIPLGFAFGFLLVQAGGPWWLSLVMSIPIYAGAAQFMAIPLLATNAPFSTIILATFVVNLRHVFYGLSLLDKRPHHPLARFYMIWSLTDETYSVLTTLPENTPEKTRLAIAALNHGWWVLGSLLGAIIGAQMPQTIRGLDFALAALFAVLTIEQWQSTKNSQAILTAIIAYALALLLMPEHALITSIALTALCALIQSQLKAKG